MDKSFDTQIETLKKEGTKIRLLEKKELKEFKEVTKFEEIQDKWAKKQQEKGVSNAADVLQKVRVLQFDSKS
ncbi:hypothetical protein IRZ80_06295 [Flavobacterium sp. HJJ]|nr:hypothetical protein [Flavobacterium sp. HJJ]